MSGSGSRRTPRWPHRECSRSSLSSDTHHSPMPSQSAQVRGVKGDRPAAAARQPQAGAAGAHAGRPVGRDEPAGVGPACASKHVDERPGTFTPRPGRRQRGTDARPSRHVRWGFAASAHAASRRRGVQWRRWRWRIRRRLWRASADAPATSIPATGQLRAAAGRRVPTTAATGRRVRRWQASAAPAVRRAAAATAAARIRVLKRHLTASSSMPDSTSNHVTLLKRFGASRQMQERGLLRHVQCLKYK